MFSLLCLCTLLSPPQITFISCFLTNCFACFKFWSCAKLLEFVLGEGGSLSGHLTCEAITGLTGIINITCSRRITGTCANGNRRIYSEGVCCTKPISPAVFGVSFGEHFTSFRIQLIWRKRPHHLKHSVCKRRCQWYSFMDKIIWHLIWNNLPLSEQNLQA